MGDYVHMYPEVAALLSLAFVTLFILFLNRLDNP